MDARPGPGLTGDLMSAHVVVAGGGIAGLAVAYELHRRGVSFTLIEERQRPGGVVLSEAVDGFVLDAGPDALLVQKPEAIKLCHELGIGERLVPTQPPRNAFIQRGGRLHQLPAASVLGIPTQWGPFIRTGLFTWPGKIRMGMELFVPRRTDDSDESIGGFMRRRFGQEATEYLAEPLLAGIHAGDVDRLSIRALFPRFAETERKHGSLLKAFRSGAGGTPPAAPKAGPPATGTSAPAASAGRAHGNGEGAFRSLPGGLSELIDALVRALPADRIHLGLRVSGVTREGSHYRVHTHTGQSFSGDAVVLATPAFATARFMRAFDAGLADRCAAIPYASAATVSLAFTREAIAHPLNGSGFVVPKAEGTGILAGSWLSSKWPGRAPAGTVLLRTFLGGARDPKALELSDAEMVERSLRALTPLIGIRSMPLFTRVYRWENANAQHEVGHLDRVRAIEQALGSHPGLFVTGSGYRGVGIPDCVADARTVGGQVTAWLSHPRPSAH